MANSKSLEKFRQDVRQTLENIFEEIPVYRPKVILTEDPVKIVCTVPAMGTRLTRETIYALDVLDQKLLKERNDQLDTVYQEYLCSLPTEDIPKTIEMELE